MTPIFFHGIFFSPEFCLEIHLKRFKVDAGYKLGGLSERESSEIQIERVLDDEFSKCQNRTRRVELKVVRSL